MACNTLTEIPRTCDDGNQGSATKIYLAPLGAVTGTTLTAGTITAIATDGTDFIEIVVNKNKASFNENQTKDEGSGGRSYAQTIKVYIPRREATKRESIALMAQGERPLALITKDGNGLYNFFGLVNGVTLDIIDSSSGESLKTGTGYNLTFAGNEAVAAPFVSSSIIAGLL